MPLFLNNDCPCPLLDPEEHKDLVDAFNHVDDALVSLGDEMRDWLRRSFSGASNGAEGDSEDLDVRMAMVRTSLSRQRYRIGFAGQFQLGKSSAVNQIFGANLLKEGGSEGCTSVVTIVEVMPHAALPSFVATYFTGQELRTRFQNVAEKLKACPVSQLPTNSEELLQAENQLREWSMHSSSDIKKHHEAAVVFLSSLARQSIEGRRMYDTSASPVVCNSLADLEKRLSKIVAYRSTEQQEVHDVAFPLLVKHVRVKVHIPDFTPLVEAIDLPGLGTMHSYDTELTKEYVRTLDGLLLFVRPNSPGNIDLQTLVTSLHAARKEIHGRVWMVVVGMDLLDPVEREGTFFKALAKALYTLEMKSDFARFLSCYCVIGGEKYETRKITDPQTLANGLNLKFDAGKIQIPECLLHEWKQFRTAFEAYTRDGGLGELRSVIETKLAITVRTAVCREASLALDRLIDELLISLRAAANGGLNGQNRTLAYNWWLVFFRVPRDLTPGKIDLSPVARGLFHALWKEIESGAKIDDIEHAKSTKHTGPPDEHPWVVLHRNLTEQMARQCGEAVLALMKQYTDLVVERIHKSAMGEEKLSKDGNLAVPQNLNPIEELGQRAKASQGRILELVKADLAQLQDVAVIQDQTSGIVYKYVSSSDYRTIMRRKVETFCYSIVEKVRSIMVADCGTIQRQLNRLSSGKDGPAEINIENLTACVSTLERAQKLLARYKSNG